MRDLELTFYGSKGRNQWVKLIITQKPLACLVKAKTPLTVPRTALTKNYE